MYVKYINKLIYLWKQLQNGFYQTYLASLLPFLPPIHTNIHIHTQAHTYTHRHTCIYLLYILFFPLAPACVRAFLHCFYSSVHLPWLSHPQTRLFECLFQETVNILKTIKYLILWSLSYFFYHSVILKIWNRPWSTVNFLYVCWMLNQYTIYKKAHFFLQWTFQSPFIYNNYNFNIMEETSNSFPKCFSNI